MIKKLLKLLRITMTSVALALFLLPPASTVLGAEVAEVDEGD